MSEKIEGTDAPRASVTGEAAAQALALSAASRDKADAFLDDQRRMLHLQMEEMRAEEPYKLSHFRLRRFSGWAKAVFEFSAGLIALALVGGLGVMVWSAAHADGLIVESFTVPPEMAQKGLGGQAIASQMLDKLTQIQRDTASVRPSKSYAGNWGDDLKVEIPETGVSVGEIYRFLRGWLGHETRVSGELYNSGDGIAVTTRISGADSVTYSGPAATLDSLLLQSAEHVYRVTQPDRYARYLYINANTGGPRRFDEARTLLNGLIASAPTREKASALHQLGVLDGLLGDTRAARADYHQAIALDPSRTITFSNLAGVEETSGISEAALTAGQSCGRLMERGADPEIAPAETVKVRVGCQIRVATQLGDFVAIPRLGDTFANAPGNQSAFVAQEPATIALARQHDGAAAIAALNSLAQPTSVPTIATRARTRLQVAAGRGDWQAVIAQAPAAEGLATQARAGGAAVTSIGTVLRPWAAFARAMTGDFTAAHALIDRTPGDCDLCLRVRGRIDAAQGNYGGADYWFARAAAAAPSIPFAHEDWGRSLLERGKPDGAIAQFTLANQKGPHFADALEGWGEALMAKNQSHLALAKFAEAEKYAPNWGRLHLKWGEALTHAGKKEDAAMHFARAAALDLAPAEKSELERVPHG